ncbi:MAG: hypothetical protein AAGA31_09200 [Bacteroidota bacterium]
MWTVSLNGQGVAFGAQYRNQLTLTIGGQYGYFKDQNFSPLSYRSGGLRFGIGYGRITKGGHYFITELGVSVSSLTPNLPDPRKPDRFLVDLSVGYLKATVPQSEKRRIDLGIKYRSYLDLTLYEGSEALSFFALHGLELAGQGYWKRGQRSHFFTDFSLPVFGLLVRPPYTGWDKFISSNPEAVPRIITRGKWTSLNDFTAFRARVGWDYQLSTQWAIGARYGLQYYATQQLKPVRILNNQFAVMAIRKY